MDVGGESVLPGAAPRKQKLDQKKMGTPTSGGGQQVLLAKKKLCTCSTLFCTFLCDVLHDYNVKRPETS